MSNTRQLRGLNYRRLSLETDESTSLERQNEQNTAMGVAKGIDWIDSLEDADVSGAISPFNREALGPYLTDPELIDLWDVLVIAKLDRLSRSIMDFGNLLQWCRQNGKSIISVSESIDFSTSVGWIFGNILMMFAEFERMRISERRSEAAAKLRQVARWNGGPVPFGYRPVCICHHDAKCGKAAGWELRIDALDAWIVHRMVRMIIAGKSAAAVARWLNDAGIPTPHSGYKRERRVAKDGRNWRGGSVRAILSNPALRGYVVQVMINGTGERFRNRDTNKIESKIIRGEDGMPVRREAILDDPTWFKLQTALQAASQHHPHARHDAHPLLGVGVCGKCGAPLWSQRSSRNRRGRRETWEYYRCSRRHLGKCNARVIAMATLDAIVEAEITARYSLVRYPEKDVTASVDNQDQMETIDQQIAELDEAHRNGELHTRAYSRQVTELETLRDRLEAEQKPRNVTVRYAEDTVADRFVKVDLEGRRQIMLALGIQVRAVRLGEDEIEVKLEETSLGLLSVNEPPWDIDINRMEFSSPPSDIGTDWLETNAGLRASQRTQLADLAARQP
jgi:site-specific DNA recombinase